MPDEKNHEQGRFEGEVLARLASIESTCQEIKQHFTDHEMRLRRTEQDMGKVKAVAAALGLMSGIVSTWLSKWISK